MAQPIHKRKQLFRRYNELYTKIKTDKCMYCGDVGETLDHIPSLNSVGLRGSDYFYKRNIVLIAVNSCRYCNSLLGAVSKTSIADRVKILAKKYKKKYKSDLDTPYWSIEEIEELDYSLSSYIEQRMIIKQWVERKLDYMLKIHEVK